MRPIGTAEELERRRLRGVDFLREDFSLSEIARRIGCHPSSVMRWRDALQHGGRKALRPKPIPGRPSRLSRRQKKRLIHHLLQGSLAHGYRTDLWTTLRIAELIRRKFGVRYHRDHVGRLLHALGWTCRKPERRAIQRDDAAIEEWKRTEWPRIKKTPRGWGPISSS